MGWDFTALVRYKGIAPEIAGQIRRLERRSPPEIRECIREFRTERYTPGNLGRHWESQGGKRLRGRPKLPTTESRLWTPEAFAFTFGKDAFLVYHMIRWSMFLEEPRLRRAMLRACAALCHRFGALECIITRDESPIISSFLDGSDFRGAIKAGGRKEREVRNINGLWIDEGDCKTLLMGGRKIRLWDSKGYWRFRWERGMLPLGKPPWAVRKYAIIPRW